MGGVKVRTTQRLHTFLLQPSPSRSIGRDSPPAKTFLVSSFLFTFLFLLVNLSPCNSLSLLSTLTRLGHCSNSPRNYSTTMAPVSFRRSPASSLPTVVSLSKLLHLIPHAFSNQHVKRGLQVAMKEHEPEVPGESPEYMLKLLLSVVLVLLGGVFAG